MRVFWDAVVELDPRAVALDESRRFPICEPSALAELWRDTSLGDVEARAIEVPTTFASFADFWNPFLGGQGSAPSYVATLDPVARDRLRDRIHERLSTDGPIALSARAWAVRGVRT